MNPWGLFIVGAAVFLVYLGITAKAGQIITHARTVVPATPGASSTAPIVVNGKVVSNTAPAGATS